MCFHVYGPLLLYKLCAQYAQQVGSTQCADPYPPIKHQRSPRKMCCATACSGMLQAMGGGTQIFKKKYKSGKRAKGTTQPQRNKDEAKKPKGH